MDYCEPFLDINGQKTTSYYVFERVKTFYYNKKGEHVSYNRTGCVDKKEHITKIIKELQSMTSNYLKHYFFVINDKVYWKKFIQQNNYSTLWLDYSQNI